MSRLQGVCPPESQGSFHAAGTRGSPVTPGTPMNVGCGWGQRGGHVCAGGGGGSGVSLVFLPALLEASEGQPRPACLGPLTLPAAWPSSLPSSFESVQGGVRAGMEWGFPRAPAGAHACASGRALGPSWPPVPLGCGGWASPRPPRPGRVPATLPRGPADPSTGLPASVPPDAGSDSPRAGSAGPQKATLLSLHDFLL